MLPAPGPATGAVLPGRQPPQRRGAFKAFADQAVLLREEDLVFRTLRHGFEQKKAAALAVQSIGMWGDSLKGAPLEVSWQSSIAPNPDPRFALCGRSLCVVAEVFPGEL